MRAMHPGIAMPLMAAFHFAACPSQAAAAAGPGVTYTDTRGNAVNFPLGDASFADEVVMFTPGKPGARDARWSNPQLAIGSPDYAGESTQTSVTLGCKGTLVLRFTDNVLVDVPGPDIYVFEVGPSLEATNLAISIDGQSWLEIGDIRGGTAYADIAAVAAPGASYRYVRLVDGGSACGGAWPGADIDAVGAIGSTLHLTFDAAVLFDVGQWVLKAAARSTLLEAVATLARFENASLTVTGHTDSRGGADYNMNLSRQRAASVREFLLAQPGLANRAIEAVGFGATRPIAPNDTDDGRQKNRRVEIVVDPRKTGPE